MTSESKKAEVESDLLTDINMLLMVEKECVIQSVGMQKLIINT